MIRLQPTSLHHAAVARRVAAARAAAIAPNAKVVDARDSISVRRSLRLTQKNPDFLNFSGHRGAARPRGQQHAGGENRARRRTGRQDTYVFILITQNCEL